MPKTYFIRKVDLINTVYEIWSKDVRPDEDVPRVAIEKYGKKDSHISLKTTSNEVEGFRRLTEVEVTLMLGRKLSGEDENED